MGHDQGQSRGPIILIVSIVFLVLSWITIALRLYVRSKMINSLGWDDATMLLGVVIFTLYCAVTIKEVTLGAGTLGVTIEAMQYAINVSFAAPSSPIEQD